MCVLWSDTISHPPPSEVSPSIIIRFLHWWWDCSPIHFKGLVKERDGETNDRVVRSLFCVTCLSCKCFIVQGFHFIIAYVFVHISVLINPRVIKKIVGLLDERRKAIDPANNSHHQLREGKEEGDCFMIICPRKCKRSRSSDHAPFINDVIPPKVQSII